VNHAALKLPDVHDAINGFGFLQLRTRGNGSVFVTEVPFIGARSGRSYHPPNFNNEVGCPTQSKHGADSGIHGDTVASNVSLNLGQEISRWIVLSMVKVPT
jgi:hypothetical protein